MMSNFDCVLLSFLGCQGDMGVSKQEGNIVARRHSVLQAEAEEESSQSYSRIKVTGRRKLIQTNDFIIIWVIFSSYYLFIYLHCDCVVIKLLLLR